jgi:hypothetical protein
MARPIQPLSITEDQRRELRHLVNRPTATQRHVRRAWIILHRAAGLSQQATAQQVRVNRSVVGRGGQRFRAHGLAGLLDQKGRGRKPCLPEEEYSASRFFGAGVRASDFGLLSDLGFRTSDFGQ